MPTPPDPKSDAAFWAALGYEMQDEPEAPIDVIGMDGTDYVFHDAPVPLDDPVDPEPLPSWGEVFTW